VRKGYRTREDFMPDEAEVEYLFIGLEEITPWADCFPGLLEAAEDALLNN